MIRRVKVPDLDMPEWVRWPPAMWVLGLGRWSWVPGGRCPSCRRRWRFRRCRRPRQKVRRCGCRLIRADGGWQPVVLCARHIPLVRWERRG